MNKQLAILLLSACSVLSYDDFRKGLDMTGKTNVTASQLNQLVDNATVNTNRGIILSTNNTPGTNFSNYLWRDTSVDPPVLRIYSSTYGWTNLVLPTNTVTTASIDNNSVTGSKLALNTISNVHLKAASVATTNIIDLAVTTDKIVNSAVTEAKINNSAVTADKIATGVITGAKLVNGTITSNQLASTTIADVNLADGAVVAGKLGPSAIVRTNLAADSVDSTNIIAGTIGNTDIAENAIAGNQVKANTLRSTNIISGGIDVTNLSANVPVPIAVCSATNNGGSISFDANLGIAGLTATTITFSNTPPTMTMVTATAWYNGGTFILYFKKGALNVGSKTLDFTTVDIGNTARTWDRLDFIIYGRD